MQETVIIIDDRSDSVQATKAFLEREGYATKTFSSGEEFLTLGQMPEFCVYIINWELAGNKTEELIKAIRVKDKLSAIYLLVDKDGPEDVLEGLKSGADDYVLNPINYDLLLVRLKNSFIRGNYLKYQHTNLGVRMIPEAWSVMKDGVTVSLTSREFLIFQYLYDNRNVVSGREQIIANFGKDSEVTVRNIDVHIFSLRKKIYKIGMAIETVRGVGYKII